MDVLFVSGVVGAALMAALAVMLRNPKSEEAAPKDQPPKEGS